MIPEQYHDRSLNSRAFAEYRFLAKCRIRALQDHPISEAFYEVTQLLKVKESFDWSEAKIVGIEDEAWQRIAKKKIDPLLVFCHPRVIQEQPKLLLYYRTAALISQKGLNTLVGGNVAGVEGGKKTSLDPKWIGEVAVALNSIISIVVKSAADISVEDIPGFQFASAGATIQGSWNNAIGKEGETAVQTILINHLRAEILQIVWRDSSTTDYVPTFHPGLIDRLRDVRVIRMKQGFHMIFSSEPDISLRDPKDLPVVSIEVKAGYDTAGALERLGAGMKSFDHDRNLNPRVKTVYVVRCMTPELQKRISQNNPFDHTFGLAELLADDKAQKTFANLILRVMLGK